MERDSPSQREIGRYSLYGEIASGGMATVYVGRLNAAGGFGRIVAIKRLHAQLARDPEFVSMFLDEARLAARIHHPNVVSTIDVVQSEDELFVVMEYIRGESLSRLVRALHERHEGMPVPVVTAIVSGVLQGLHAAHEAKDERGEPLGIVHRDVSPQNILVGEDGVARVLDFGVAKAASRLQHTRDGELKGKLGYMAPEQISERTVTAQSDVYAAGIVLWEALTGTFLFRGKTDGETLHRIMKREVSPPSSSNAAVSAKLDAVIIRALEIDPAARFATAHDMAVALDAAERGASTIEVGEWVKRIADATLQSRLQMVHDIESGTVDSLSGVPVLPSGILGRAEASSAGSGKTASQLSTAITLRCGTPSEQRRRRTRRRLLIGGMAIGAGAVVGFALTELLSAPVDDGARQASAGAGDSADAAPAISSPPSTAIAPSAPSEEPAATGSASARASAGARTASPPPSTRSSATAKTSPKATGGNDLDKLIETRK